MKSNFLRTRIGTFEAENQFTNMHIQPHKKLRRSYK